MATLKSVIDRALRRAHIVADGEDPDTEQAHPAVSTLNEMLEQWRDEGLDLGLPEYTTSDYDTGTLEIAADKGATRTLIYNLAVETANDAGMEISAVTDREAERSRASLASRLHATKRVRFDTGLTRRRC